MKLLDQLRALEPPARERAPLLERIGLTEKAVDPRDLLLERTKAWGKSAVGESEDLTRIAALPRRPRPTDEEQETMAAVMTALLRRDNPDCRCKELKPDEPCITDLLPIQGWYLYEASQVGGAIGFIVVGGGKTGIDILLPMVVPKCTRALLLVPPSLRSQFALDYERWSQHFKTPNLAGGRSSFYPGRPVLDVLAYSELSNPSCATWFQANRPEVVIGDEAQALKDKESVRTDRFLRFSLEAEDAGGIRFFPHSGSMTTDELDDYGHLIALALRENSPVPIALATLREWAGAINPPKKGGGAPMGALRVLCEPGETVRQGFARRLVETRGVITTADHVLPNKLHLIERDPGPLPKAVRDAMLLVRSEKRRPDGEELVELLERVTALQQLAYGFYYRWRYPAGHVLREDGTPEEDDAKRAIIVDDWFLRRQSWNRELRARLEYRTDLLDSPGLLEEAAERARTGYVGELPVWHARSWAAWREMKDRVNPVPEAVWIDDFLVRDAAAWAREAPGVVWYRHGAFGQAVAKVTGFPRYGSGAAPPANLNPTPAMLERRAALIRVGQWEGGDIADNWLKTEDGSRSIVCSLRAHYRGKNMQAWWRALIANVPASGEWWEQVVGRHHRRHQKAPVVEVHVYRHTPEVRQSLDDAREAAKYVFETTRKMEKLIFAERVGWR